MFRSFGKAKWLMLCLICITSTVAAGYLAVSTLNKDQTVGAAVTSSSKSASPQVNSEAASKAGSAPSATQVSFENMKAVWIATAANIDFPSKQGLTAEQQKAEIKTMLDKIKSLGMNTVYFQVRPNADALYKSEYYPWSAVLTGTQGKDPGYDPLACFIEEGHKRGLKVQAWINPYRVQPTENIAKLSDKSPAKQHQDWTVKYGGGLYYDPGLPEVRQLIINGVKEIVENYNVDGVHLDDYFYPGTDFGDSASYKKYGGKTKIDDWRRQNVNELVMKLHETVKQAKPQAQFGISPFAIWANKSQNTLGSDTNGKQTYYDMYADTRLWVKNNWLDYVCPQVYWSIGFKKAPFENVTKWWAETVKGTGVKLYIGHAVYKINTDEAGWKSPDQIVKQIKLARQYKEYQGSAFYGYRQLVQNTAGVTDSIMNYYKGMLEETSFGKNLSITQPQNMSTDESQIKISGSSDANFPLYLNNSPVSRNKAGLFSQTLNLKPGRNTFIMSHKGETKSLKVNYNIIVLKQVGPTSNIFEVGNTPVSIFALAHKDANVFAQIGGKKIKLSPSSLSGSDNSDKPQTISDFILYSGVYTLPQSTAKTQNLGRVMVTAVWNGYSGRRSGAEVKVRPIAKPNPGVKQVAVVTPAAAEVNKQYVETFLYNDDLYRPVTYPQQPGSWDYIETNADGTPKKYICPKNGFNAEYYKLSCGMLIYAADVKLQQQKEMPDNIIGSVVGSSCDSDRYTRFTFDFSQKVTYSAGTNIAFPANKYGTRNYTVSNFNATTFQITFYNTEKAPNVGKFSSPLISSVDCNKINDTTFQYVFHLKHAGVFYGSYISYDHNGDLTVDFKNPWNGDMSKLKIAIDAGHGGYDTGASSPSGKAPNEKDVNLSYALMVRDKLVAMGVKKDNIYMVRTGDTYTDLMVRTVNMINFRPDFSLCIHNNAFNGTAVGVESYYFQPFSQPLVKDLQTRLLEAYRNGAKAYGGKYYYKGMGTDRGACFSSAVAYYSCRQVEMPSTLIECGFVDNPNEYEWLTSTLGTDLMTTAIADGVMDYMKSEKPYSDNPVSSALFSSALIPSDTDMPKKSDIVKILAQH